MSKLKTIVIGTSLTEASDGVVRTGVALARATGASVWLLNAYLPYLPHLPFTFPFGGSTDAQLIEEHVRDVRKQVVEQARRTGLSVFPGFSPAQARLVAGAAHREIVELARRVQADLIVMGAREGGEGSLGSTADRVIRKSPCPVFVVRSETSFPPTRVEISVDLSPISVNALRQGLNLLVEIGATLSETEVLFVLNPLEVAGSVQFTPEQIQRFASEEMHRLIAANTPEGKHPGLQRIRHGYPQQEILAALDERRADLAVLGTHGRSGFERLMMGSVAAGVLRRANCNLLIVPPDESQQNEPAREPAEELTGADWNYVSDEHPPATAKPAPVESLGEFWFG
jgi:universal stress protein E